MYMIDTSSLLKTFTGSLIATALQYGWSPGANSTDFKGYGKVADCSLSGFVPSFPSNQTQLTVPSNLDPEFIGLAFGVQNYTCSSSNTFTNVGAVAEIIDASCYVNASWFPTIQDLSRSMSIQQTIEFVHFLNPPANLAQHYFVHNPVTNQGLSPKWDFTSNGKFEGNSEAFVIGRVNGTLSSPNDAATDITWLEVLNVEGKIAGELFRFDSVGGQPPSSCTYGNDSDISVNYVAKYIFYGGDLN
ncbi:uncharacterized protein B0H18DRAFT_1093073 [Fomitopsis serialis]|uniref:uncharacterized protein n=1 Tax=Fomitopsis serialis TaxID=139415 RepID=UPI00200835E9|nr:uncharacterized protein B0H18DRAFT_1093073 [Neoantrodia serialis]KAH9933049.1 hypothetical protein B0H18DRAFT_1093073 [Neoantrodia serialis]